MTLAQKIGDTVTHRIPLRWAKRKLDTTGRTLIFTVKRDPADADADALFQKAYPSGGIAIDDGDALVQVLPSDTIDEPATVTLFWDIQATDGDGDSRTVNGGEFELIRDITRLTEPAMDIHTVAPPLLFFSYQSYLETTDDDPVLTEEQWVARLGSSNPQITATQPPIPSNGYPLPYEGLEWFDPSDGSTSVWMWLDADAANDSEDDGVFVSQFPTPADTGIPDKAYLNESGDAYVDEAGNFYVSE